MKVCSVSSRFYCFKTNGYCPDCNIQEIEKLDQMTPKERTVGELITILQQYPPETKLVGLTPDWTVTDLITVQGNCPDFELDSVMICYYSSK